LVFTHTTLASVDISCSYVSVRLSQVDVLLKRLNVGSSKQCHMTAQGGTLVFWCWKSRQNSKGVTPNGSDKCRWRRLNTGAVPDSCQRLTPSVVKVNLVQSQVYHSERPPYLFAAHSLWCSMLHRFVSDSW